MPTGIAVFTVTVTANFEVLRRIVSPSTAGRDHSGGFFFGNQFHYPLHGEKARFGLKAAARPVSNSGEE